MSWQVATFGLLLCVLAGGFVWYERSRPSARLLGLVAALAALAAASRVALSPVPNVTPTTDIALLSGYSLGAPAGFVVGALAALISNFWLGQGPWTPWQMAAWGLAGLAGAALAKATGRRLGRFGLAGACALAGLLYGALLDLSVMVTYGGEQSLERYLALSARGIPFNFAHALGNAAFALAVGPALVRILTRFRARLEFDWPDPPATRRRDGLAAAGATTALLLSVVFAASLVVAPSAAAGGAADARQYLERSQNSDGGLPATPGGSSSVAITGWAMLGLEAGGRNPLDLRRAGRSPVNYLRANADSIKSTGDLERTILALDGAGISSASFGGRNLIAELSGRRSGNGSFQGQVNLTAFGILALRATGTSSSAVRSSADWLRKAQNRDGGWGFQPGLQSEADSTGAALQALAAAGNRGGASARGARFLSKSQRSDGGWPLAFGGPTNSQSTAWAVQGLVAAGSSVSSGGNDPLAYLAARQATDGHYRYSASSDQTPVWVTGQAMLAVAREPFPLERVPRASEPGGVPLPDFASGGGDDGGKGRGDASGSGRGGEDRGGGDEREASATESKAAEAAEAGEVDEPGSEIYEAAGDEDGLDTQHFVAAGFAALLIALGAGFVIYRRRLP